MSQESKALTRRAKPATMNEENQLLVTDEPVEFEK
jgi:hypothetical protein